MHAARQQAPKVDITLHKSTVRLDLRLGIYCKNMLPLLLSSRLHALLLVALQDVVADDVVPVGVQVIQKQQHDVKPTAQTLCSGSFLFICFYLFWVM